MLIALKEIILAPGVALQLGLMTATALIFGFFLYDGRTLLKVVVGTMIFIAFEEWVRFSLNDVIYAVPVVVRGEVPITLSFLTSILFFGALGVGVLLAYRDNRKRRRAQTATDDRIAEIKKDTSSAGMAKIVDRRTEKTRPIK